MAVALDERLLEVLACPADHHAPLRPGSPDDPDAEALTCTACGRVYPVREGIPVLLLDEAVAGAAAPDSAAAPDKAPDSAQAPAAPPATAPRED